MSCTTGRADLAMQQFLVRVRVYGVRRVVMAVVQTPATLAGRPRLLLTTVNTGRRGSLALTVAVRTQAHALAEFTACRAQLALSLLVRKDGIT